MRMIIYMTIMLLMMAIIPVTAYAAEYDVTSFGAVADDGADDSEGIASAIAAADSGDTVLLPAGTFHVSDSVVLTNGVTFAGQGAEESIIKYLEEKNNEVVIISDVSHVIMHDMTIAGSDSSSNGILIARSAGNTLSDLVIRDITMPDAFSHGIYCAADVDSSVFSRITFSNIAVASKWGAGIRIAWGSCYNQVLDCTMTDMGRGGVLCNDNANGNIILRNTIQRYGLAEDSAGLGIEIWGDSDSCIVEDNVIDHWLSIAGSDFCAVRRNTIKASGDSWISYGIEYATGVFNVFADNAVGEGQRLGISISGNDTKEHTLFIRNTIGHATTWGMQCQGEEIGARNIYFYNNTFANTYAEHPEAWYDNQGHGIRFNGGSCNITLEKNQLLENGSAAIQYLSDLDSLSFISNSIVGNAKVYAGVYSGEHVEYINNGIGGNANNNLTESDSIEGERPVAGWSAVMEDGAVRFTSESTDADGIIKTLLWDMGDGIPTNESSPLHAYPEDGIYKVTLTVWDNDGRGDVAPGAIKVDSGTVTILSPPEIVTETLPDAPEGTVSQITIQSEDDDGNDTLTYDLMYGPDWLAMNGDDVLTGVPPEGMAGFKKAVVVRVTDESGLSDTAMYMLRIGEPVSVEESVPEPAGLMTPYPNPFNPVVTIPFRSDESGPVTVTIYAANGQQVAVLANSTMNPGDHRITWDASGCSSGLYFCRFSQGNVTSTKKVLLLR